MRIAIVNDMPMAVEAMRRVLSASREHEVAWVAHDGDEAVAHCASDRPDLILMDLIMPKTDGVDATRRIMARTPCPIVIVTSSITDHKDKVFEALGSGALDAVNTPVLGTSSNSENGGNTLLLKINRVRDLVAEASSTRQAASQKARPAEGTSIECLVAVGASAGGPAAVAEVLKGLPKDFPAAVVLVQHIDEQFAPGLAEWLHGQSALPVRLAREGDGLTPGVVLVAGTSDHLVLKSATQLGYVATPRENPYRPSIDVFFHSVTQHWRRRTVGVLLTGMGRDGAKELKSLRDAGHHTIAQDKATSAVYGMPKAAAQLDAADEILPLDRIAPRLAALAVARKKL